MRRLRGESGFTLAFSLITLVFMSAVLVSIVDYTSSNARNSSRSKGDQVAYALAEAGINNAMAVLSNPTNNALSPTLLPSRTATYEGGTVTWSGTFNSQTAYWTITSTSRVANPAAPGQYRGRTLTASVEVIPTLSQPLNTQAWNYIFSRATGSTCDMTLSQSVSIGSPLYVSGNLCLQNQASITKGPLVVGGRLTLNTSNNTVGTSSTKISSAAIGNGCVKQSTTQTPCTGGSAVSIYATSLTSTVPVIAPPTVDWDGWYGAANPGPYFPCTTTSGTLPTFDTDAGSTFNAAKRNNSVPAVVNLTPSSSYTCRTVSGELSWNAATKVLTVNGTIFIDGSAEIQNGAVNTYNGFATIYLSGTLLIKNSKLCAVLSSDGSTCSSSGWTSNSKMLVFVVGGNGSAGGAQGQVASGNSIELTSAYFQGALYATNGIDVATTSQVDGPLDGGTIKLGQSVASSWPAFTVVPAGMPGNPVAYAEPQRPSVSG